MLELFAPVFASPAGTVGAVVSTGGFVAVVKGLDCAEVFPIGSKALTV
jgi:hypothetical protein